MNHNLPAIPMSDLQVMAKAFASSGLFGVKNESQALALCLVAQSEGIHPARAVQEFFIVEGRPCLSSSAAMSRFMAAGGKISWTTMTDEKVEGTAAFGGETLTLSWDFARAKAAGLANRPNYSKFPRQMLKARCAAELIRAIAPGTLSNFYVKEEIEGGVTEIHEPTVINEAPLTIEAKTVAQETTGNIQAALAGKKHTPVKSQPVIDVQPEVKAKPVSAGRDALAASVAQDLAELSELTQDPAEMILEMLTKGTIKTPAALATAMFSHLSKLDTLVKAALIEARANHQDSFDPFENDLTPENPFETN